MALSYLDGARSIERDVHDGDAIPWSPFDDPSSSQYGIRPGASDPSPAPSQPGAASTSEPPLQGTAAELRRRRGHMAENARVPTGDSEDDILITLSKHPIDQRLLALEQFVFEAHDRKLKHLELQVQLLTQQLDNVRGMGAE